MPDGTLPTPGGWNRFALEVEDLDAVVDGLRASGARFRNAIVEGRGGRQILVEDPSGNPVELFEPTRADARLEADTDASPGEHAYLVRPIGWVESSLVDRADAPNQGYLGAPDAWIAINAEVREGIRDLRAGSDILVLTWLHLSRRDELATRPGNDPTRAELGVFSTRSPARPNPIGLHRATVIATDEGRLQVSPLEAIDGTPVIDIKPVLSADGLT